MISKKTLLKLCKEYDTPLYVYHAEKIIENYQKFVKSFHVGEMKVYFACKALNNLSILKLFKSLGAGLDCVSLQEIQLGLLAGFKPEEILFTPNNISEEEYLAAIELGVKINIDNLHILEFLGIRKPELPVCIRINPHMMAGGNRNISVGHIDSKFGISIHQLPLLKRIVKNLGINVEGIHVHTGSDILDTGIFAQAAELIFSVADEFNTVKYIDFGSGFKVRYHPTDHHTNIETFGKEFSDIFNEHSKKAGKDYILKFEPGKFLVSEAGYFLTKVNVVKQTTSCTFIGVNSGFNHLVRPMFYDAYHHIENISNTGGPEKIYSIVGYICETDTFGTDRLLNEVRKDDILLFKNAGAYCFSMSSNYNSRLKPPEILLFKGKPHLVRQRETLDDLLRNQVDCGISNWK